MQARFKWRRTTAGLMWLAMLLVSTPGCMRHWACGDMRCHRPCRSGHWLSGLRLHLMPTIDPAAPNAKFHPLPTDNVFAPRSDSLPAPLPPAPHAAAPMLMPQPEFGPTPPQPPGELLPPSPQPTPDG
ncbi:MAG: hypothetical protein RIC55_13825 [Pirellulaceae bacterium]